MATKTIVRLADLSSNFVTNASASATYQTKVANVSDAEIGYLDGVTSGIQSQINSKLSISSASTTYLTQISASTQYLTMASASTTYSTISSPQFSGNVGIGVTGDSGSQLTLGRSSTTEGGQLGFSRGVDNALSYYFDVFGSTTSPTFRLVDAAASSVRMSVDSGGRVIMPAIPAVYAFNTTNTTVGDNGVIIYNSAYLNNGSHYNTSTSTFTAPVAGRYFVLAKVLTFNDSNPSDMRIAVNGTKVEAYAGYSLVAGALSSYKQGHVHGVVNLAANDTIQIRATGSVSFYGSATAGHTSLSIHLIG